MKRSNTKLTPFLYFSYCCGLTTYEKSRAQGQSVAFQFLRGASGRDLLQTSLDQICVTVSSLRRYANNFFNNNPNFPTTKPIVMYKIGMDPSNDQHSNPYHHTDPKPEDRPEDKPEDEPESEQPTRKQERRQPLAMGPFSKPSGYLTSDYFHRQQRSLTWKEDSASEIQCQNEDENSKNAEESSEDEPEEEVKDLSQEDEDGCEVEEKRLKGETCDEIVPGQLMTDQDVTIQAKPEHEEGIAEETCETASAQETRG